MGVLYQSCRGQHSKRIVKHVAKMKGYKTPCVVVGMGTLSGSMLMFVFHLAANILTEVSFLIRAKLILLAYRLTS